MLMKVTTAKLCTVTVLESCQTSYSIGYIAVVCFLVSNFFLFCVSCGRKDFNLPSLGDYDLHQVTHVFLLQHTPVYNAARKGHKEVVMLLIEHGAKQVCFSFLTNFNRNFFIILDT